MENEENNQNYVSVNERNYIHTVPAHSTLHLAVATHTGGKPHIRPEWKHQQGWPCRTWVQQIEDDTGLNANDAWRIAHDLQVLEGATTHGWSSVPLTD